MAHPPRSPGLWRLPRMRVIVPSNALEQRVTRDSLCGIGTTSAPTVSAVEGQDGTLESGTPISLRINGGAVATVSG